MPEKRYNRGGIDQGLAELLGLKGQLNSTVESIMRLVLVATDLTDSPFDKISYPVGCQGTNAGVALEFPYLAFIAGPSKILQLRKFTIMPHGVAFTADLRVLSNAQLGSGLTLSQQFTKLHGDGPTDWESVSSSVQEFTSLNASLGDRIDQVTVPADATAIIELPAPGILLTGNSPRVGVCLVGAIGDEIAATAYGKEWPIPG